jgi:hypothetical protein
VKNLLYVAERGPERFEIVDGGEVGVYIFRYLNGFSTHDYLQDDIEKAQICAADEFGLPPSAWRPARPAAEPP